MSLGIIAERARTRLSAGCDGCASSIRPAAGLPLQMSSLRTASVAVRSFSMRCIMAIARSIGFRCSALRRAIAATLKPCHGWSATSGCMRHNSLKLSDLVKSCVSGCRAPRSEPRPGIQRAADLGQRRCARSSRIRLQLAVSDDACATCTERRRRSRAATIV